VSINFHLFLSSIFIWGINIFLEISVQKYMWKTCKHIKASTGLVNTCSNQDGDELILVAENG
jgi:hypothetical protein